MDVNNLILPEHLGLNPLPPALAVAVSGGADSMALALWLGDWCKTQNIFLVALTVDHALRPESTKEAHKVAEWLLKQGIVHHILTWQHVEKPTANLQANARNARYQLMINWCKEHDIQHLCLAHHLDDQAETFLIRLGRGSGVDGLSGMRAVSLRDDVTLLRPLLGIRKTALIRYLQSKNQAWIDDPSNQAQRFTRTHMRTLIPILGEAGIQVETLARTATHMARARDFLDQMCEAAWQVTLFPHENGFKLAIEPFRNLHPEMAFRVLAKLLQTLSGQEYRPRFNDLERLHYALLTGEKARTLEHCLFRRKKEHYEVTKEYTAE